ncbi:MAG: DUF6788 family protein [Thermoplasmataceae archaeon]|jgi:hypothetical protein
MKEADKLEDLRKQVKELSHGLKNIGFALHGSIWKHYMKCGNVKCKCHESPPKLHGPYYDWSRKIKGKTVNIRLDEEQAKMVEKWIQNMKRLENVLSEIEATSIRAAELIRK